MVMTKINQATEEAAREVKNYVDNAAGDVAFEIFGHGKPYHFWDDESEIWYKKIKAENPNLDFMDLTGSYADHLYNQAGWLGDMMGDKIYDCAHDIIRKLGCAKEMHGDLMLQIAEDMRPHQHSAMIEAIDNFMNRYLPKGFKFIKWEKVENGQNVYILGKIRENKINKPHAYGPHQVQDKEKRELLNPTGDQFCQLPEGLLVKV